MKPQVRALQRGAAGSRAWVAGSAAAGAACLLAFALNGWLAEIEPGSAWSLGYGAAATVLLVLAAAYGIRRRSMRTVSRLGLGSARTWLRLHLAGGAIFLLLVLMHSGFQVPEGKVTFALWALSLWLTASGAAGAALQRWVPRQLASGLSLEVHWDRIPELVEELRARGERIAAAGPKPVRDLWERTVAPRLERPERRWIYLLDVSGGVRGGSRQFTFLEGLYDDEGRQRVRDLHQVFRTKLEIDAHYTLQWLLRAWVALHAPPALLLVALVAVHLLTVFLY